MKFSKERIEFIKKTIASTVKDHPKDLVPCTMDLLGITRPTVMRYLKELIQKGIIRKTGTGRGTVYCLKEEDFEIHYPLRPGLSEDAIWQSFFLDKVADLPVNVKNIPHYGATEIINNAIDHSNGKTLHVGLVKLEHGIDVIIRDDGVGIFNKIQEGLGLQTP